MSGEDFTRGLLDVPCPPHVLSAQLRGNTFWTVCEKCGEETEGGTTEDVLIRNLAYIFRDFEAQS